MCRGFGRQWSVTERCYYYIISYIRTADFQVRKLRTTAASTIEGITQQRVLSGPRLDTKITWISYRVLSADRGSLRIIDSLRSPEAAANLPMISLKFLL